MEDKHIDAFFSKVGMDKSLVPDTLKEELAQLLASESKRVRDEIDMWLDFNWGTCTLRDKMGLSKDASVEEIGVAVRKYFKLDEKVAI